MAGFHKVAGWGPEENRDKNDYYPTPPLVTRCLLEKEIFPGDIMEPCAGSGHIVKELYRNGYDIYTNELYPRQDFNVVSNRDFLKFTERHDCISLVTNPPFKLAEEFVRKAIELDFEKHAWLLRFQFIEGAKRNKLFKEYPPARIWVFSKRVQVSEMGLENPLGGMIVYAWWIWERGFKGHPELRWFSPEDIEAQLK